MRVINILELLNGIPSQIQSFPIYEEQLDGEVVEQAEKLFEEMIRYHENDITDEDIEACIEEGVFDDNNGHELYIIWSEIN